MAPELTSAEPTVIGRTAELAELSAFVGGLPARGGIVVLEGDAGIGKTILWRAALRQAEAAGHRILVARPGETESKPAYGALIDLLGGPLPEVLSELPAPQASTLEVALLRREGRVDQPGVVAVAACTALRGLAARRPTVVAIDDFQWLDGPSKRVLQHVARRLDREPIALLITERPPTELAQGLDERLTRLRLGPLSLGSLHHVVREKLGIALERPLLIRVERASGGNPLYALEIVRSLPPEALAHGARDGVPIPSTLPSTGAWRPCRRRLGRRCSPPTASGGRTPVSWRTPLTWPGSPATASPPPWPLMPSS